MIAMKNSKDILNNAIEEVSEKELMEVAGGKRGTGWFATITDDCRLSKLSIRLLLIKTILISGLKISCLDLV